MQQETAHAYAHTHTHTHGAHDASTCIYTLYHPCRRGQHQERQVHCFYLCFYLCTGLFSYRKPNWYHPATIHRNWMQSLVRVKNNTTGSQHVWLRRASRNVHKCREGKCKIFRIRSARETHHTFDILCVASTLTHNASTLQMQV
jgi:hypothetical protein